MNVHKQSSNLILLLRCWEEYDAETQQSFRRFSLEDPSTNKRQGFADIETLLEVLKLVLSDKARKDVDEPESNET